jgi:hypothetical protein
MISFITWIYLREILNSKSDFKVTALFLIDYNYHCSVLTYNNLYPEQYGLLGCNAMEFSKIPTFRSNLSPPSPGSKRKPSRSRQEAECSTPGSAGWFTLRPRRWERRVPPKRPAASELHSFTTQSSYSSRRSTIATITIYS